MNIFAVNVDPGRAAQQLPDKHVTKMILESAQMLSIVYSPHYWDIGTVAKVNGEPFKTQRGAFKKHPCTIWAAESPENCAWLLHHAICMCDEFQERYGKRHGLGKSLFQAKKLFHREVGKAITIYRDVTGFARAMPDDIKNDASIDDVTAYQRYMNTKPWCYNNYLRIPSRRPDWLLPQENDSAN